MLKKGVGIYISQKSGKQRGGWQQGEVQQENLESSCAGFPW